MGKDQILDPLDYAEIGKGQSAFILRPAKLLFFLIFSLTILFSGCSFPKIIILKDPLTPEEHLNLGVTYERRGEFDQAIREYQLAAKKLPIAFLYLGNAYFLKNDWDQAEIYFKKAIEKDAKNAAAHNNLAWLYYQRGKNLEQAEALAQKALELDPSQSSNYRDTVEKVREKKKATQH
jgi:tetratricopeptide (TPR) repeat protein